MGARQSIWPLLLYGALVAIAAARRRQAELQLGAAIDATSRGSVLKISPPLGAKDENASAERGAAPAEADKRPREHFENDEPVSAQLRRAGEPGRGRRATAPWRIPWRGWKDIFWRVYASVNDNRLLAVAAGVVFYTILAIFPAIAAFVSLYGLVADASTIDFASFSRGRHFSRGSGRNTPRANHEASGEKRCGAQPRLCDWACRSLLERQRRNESHHRRPQRRL